MERKGIYRREFIENQKQKWKGKVLLKNGAPAWMVAFLSSLFVITLFLLVYYLEYTRRIDVSGEIITYPHSINIYSPMQGYVKKAYVALGDKVNKGDPLYEVSVARMTLSGNVNAERKEALDKQIANIDSIITKLKKSKKITILNLQSQLEQYVESHEETKKLVASAREGVKNMRAGMASYEEYRKKGLITKDQLNNQRFLFYQQQNGYQGLNSQSIQEGLQISKLQSEILTQSSEYENKIAEYEYQLHDLKRKIIEYDADDTTIVSAQITGLVESLSVTPGQMVNVGSSLAQIRPTTDVKYYLVIWVPNNSLPYIKQGDSINIRYDAFPSEKFGQFPGKIESISSIPVSNQEISEYNIPALNNNGMVKDNYYKVLVAVKNTEFSDKGKEMHLSSGLKANAIVFLEERPLYQWMFVPFYGIKNSVTGKIDE
ncbi:HlyD family secretion protein [Serratia sp. NPDC078593]|uniref:HlyD family secretion protein n=1 Tax=unclassified Serratia (in: enterobacteria) TaxID=2647522 RepID=UPI0037D81BC5